MKAAKIFLTVMAVLSTTGCVEAKKTNSIEIDLQQNTTRTWLGPEFWANRLQDWQLNDGRIECIETRANKPYRTAHLLTKQLADKNGDFEILLWEQEASGYVH